MLTAADVWEGLGSQLISSHAAPETSFARGSIDSRDTAPGSLFFALRGERRDGHGFVPQAVSAGASGVVMAKPPDNPAPVATFQVTDPLIALQRLASYWRNRHDLKVVGVTGSVGKTTVKEVVAGVLSSRFNTAKTEANLNTEIGVPLTLLQLRPEHERAVLELAMYQPGDIRLLARIARPDVGIVTNVGPVHMERAGSIGRIAAGKAELVESLPAGGLAVLNGDDPRTAAMAGRTRARPLLFGLSSHCSLRALNVVSRGLDGFSFDLQVMDVAPVAAPRSPVRVECPLPGKHHVYAALAAAAVALDDGFAGDEIAEALRDARVPSRLTQRPGPNGSTLIDDSYNASPASMIAALDLLSETSGRRIAVLGHMRELGAAEAAGHESVGRHAPGRCDLLIVVGDEAKALADAAEASGHKAVRRFQTAGDATSYIEAELREGDVCLVKASRAVGLESLVGELVAR
jgi:UDP-N-acetylmuramoyl-tripeptide--D-alanyl-D-alanine ligase